MKKMNVAVGKVQMPATTAAGPGEFKQIKVAEIRVRPQIRKTFKPGTIAEMAESIKVNGIIQPLVVRWVKAEYKVVPPELDSKDWRLLHIESGKYEASEPTEILIRCHVKADRLEDHYELIMGERRLRGADMAGLKEVPCLVREATEEERFAWQFIENHARENVSKLEEAEALKAQLDERQEATPGFSAEDLADELGISRAQIYERLKLTRLSAAVKEALESGRISTSVAQVVATLPTPQDQEKILKLVTNEQDYRFPFSVRKVQELTDTFMQQLDDAPFDKAKKDYPSQWGPGQGTVIACTGCSKRTGNMLAEFPELKGRPNVCTEPACFAAKCQAHFMEQAEKFRKAGHVVMTMKELADAETDYTAVHRHIYNAKMRQGSAKELAGKYAPKTVVAVQTTGLEEFYVTAEWRAAAIKNKVEFYDDAPTPAQPAVQETPAERKERVAKEEAERVKKQKLMERREAFVAGLLPTLKAAIAKLKDGPAWELASRMLDNYDQYDQDDEFLKVLVKGAPAGKAVLLGKLFSGFDAAPIQHAVDWDKRALEYWQTAGIDVKAEWTKAEKAAQAELVIPKGGPKQKTLLDVPATPGKTKGKMSPTGLARIRAAQKARWAKVKAAKG